MINLILSPVSPGLFFKVSEPWEEGERVTKCLPYRSRKVLALLWSVKLGTLNLGTWILSLQSYSWQWQHWKIYEFILRNIPNQNKHTKVKDSLLLTKEVKKLKKIHFWVDGWYGNVNHHKHVIETGNFLLINLGKVKRFGDYSSSRLKVIIRQSQHGHNFSSPPLLPRLNRVKGLNRQDQSAIDYYLIVDNKNWR